MQVKVLFARFPGGACDHPDTTDWLVQTVIKAKADPRISQVMHWRIDDTPITMGRNRCLEEAKKVGADIVLMIDSDMKPDAYHSGCSLPIHVDPQAKPFWDTSLDFMLEHDGPCAVAAPYCGPPPQENVYVFKWGKRQSDHPNADMSLDQYSREESVPLAGIQEAGALPTGLFMLDMRALKAIPIPYFRYEWQDKTESQKASTEDVYFTRDLSLVGIPQYCNWDAWAGHWKRKCVGRPILMSVDSVRNEFRDAVLRNQPMDEKLIHVKESRRDQIRAMANGN